MRNQIGAMEYWSSGVVSEDRQQRVPTGIRQEELHHAPKWRRPITPSLHHSIAPFRPLLFLAALCFALPATAATNLVVNGSWDDKAQPLRGWQVKFDQQGESWYAENHTLVSVVPAESGRRDVLRLNVATQFLADNPGVKTESAPIPVKPGGKYRFGAWARSNGPNCRIMLEGYKWKPGVKPHDNPTIYELRKCYRFTQLYFGKEEAGTMGGVDSQWRHATQTVPEGKMGEQQQRNFDEIQFLVVHLVGIGGTAGDLYVDDVTLERVP